MQQFLDNLKALHERCQYNQHRGLVLLAGEQQWTETICAEIHTILPDLRATPITDSAAAKQILGTDTNSVFFNVFAGFNLNALAISAGTIKGGGLLILQCPPLENWDSFDDPEYQRLLAHPFVAADISGLFLKRFARLLSADANVLRLEQNRSLDNFELPPKAKPLDFTHAYYASADQQKAVERITKLCGGRARRPLLITADRGRGKSAALGLAAAELLGDENTTVTITAPSPKAAATAIKHANNAELTFMSPDDLLDKKPDTRLLLIDEAAAIPLPLLEKLVSHYPRVVLTTTVHGYEGTGRAFQLRFSDVLDQITPDWQHLEISQAVRFANNDPLEAFIHRALILDPELSQTEIDSDDPVSIQLENRKELAADESRLRSIFGLLMLAHYQTTPDDLRHMLDAPNIDVFSLNINNNVVATALVAKEGSLDEFLIEKIHSGERRPKGHLLPQTLIFQCNLPTAGTLPSARIIRIAVQPHLQRRGFGRQLLPAIEQHYRNENFSLVGTSFGLAPKLLDFWQSQNYYCVRVGSRRNAASSYHSALLLKPLDEKAAAVTTQAKARFAPLFIAQLPSVFKKLDPRNVRSLLTKQKTTPALSEEIVAQAQSYISKKRNRFDVLDSIQLLLLDRLGQLTTEITESELNLLIACFLQQRSDTSLCQQFEINGTKSLTAELRNALQKVLPAPC